MNITSFLVAIISSIFLLSCNFNKRKEKKIIDNNFYSNLGGLGRARIPLIEPYELLKVSGDEWRLELQHPDLLTLSIHNVKGVFVNDGVIAIYSKGGTEVLNKLHDSAWFIIKVDRGLEKAFDSQEAFKEEYEKLITKRNINLYLPDSLYKLFEKNGKITW